MPLPYDSPEPYDTNHYNYDGAPISARIVAVRGIRVSDLISLPGSLRDIARAVGIHLSDVIVSRLIRLNDDGPRRTSTTDSLIKRDVLL